MVRRSIVRGVGCAMVAWAVAATSLAAPKLEVKPEVFDWGRQAKNAGTYEYVFNLKNAGDAVLKIEEVRPGCGCTTAAIAKKELAPGEAVELKGVLNVAGSEGAISKAIFVRTNDPGNNNRVLLLKLAVPFTQTGVRLNPRNGHSIAQRQGPDWLAFVTVENCDATGDVSVTNIVLPDGWKVRDRVPFKVLPETRFTVTFMRSAADAPAFKDLPFSISTDHKVNAEFKGTISSPVTPTVTATATGQVNVGTSVPVPAVGGIVVPNPAGGVSSKAVSADATKPEAAKK